MKRLQTLASLTKAGIASTVKMIACAKWIQNHLSAPPSQTSCRVASYGQTRVKNVRSPMM
ncbi:MAG: hypothetical protein DMG10_12985 [Acidobacteria bacterium]|nr:MAG: hypothetical protein DMG10_12985 [Acidobacteriota bacterium]